MKSIRLSLVLYFLVLLAVALGAVSVWAYQRTRGILDVNEKRQGELLRQQCDSDCQRERMKFEEALWQKALNLATQARIQHQFNQFLEAEIGFHEYVLSPASDDQVSEYFIQINSEPPRNSEIPSAWHSPSMADRSFGFDLENFRKMRFYDRQVEETELKPGLPAFASTTLGLLASPPSQGPLLAAVAAGAVSGRIQPTLRIVRLATKVPVAWRRWIPGGRAERRAGNGSGQAGRVPSGQSLDSGRRPLPPFPDFRGPHERPSPAFYIQCAAEAGPRDARIREFQAKLSRDLASLREQSAKALWTLRNRLLLLSLATLAATWVGGVWLVRLGLSPLQRLSIAVSRVSAKDFKLPLDERRLPQELRPIVERLTQTLELLKRTFAREKQAAADISHELRTPLAALLTTTEVGLRKPRSAEEYRELLADCHASGQQMSQLIERLLALARLDAGVDTLRPREVDASSVAEQCATLVRPLAAARGLTLRVERNGPVILHTDPDKLREILNNLLHNAIEYNRPEGSIELALGRQNGHVLVEVRDTGIGIEPAAMEQIFERFYRADPSRQADGLHAGLGLAIVKGYVDLMGGKISVQSTEGQGTTFRIELPVVR